MTKTQVSSILGVPEEAAQDSLGTRWYYGVSPGSGVPTLGTVFFNDRGLFAGCFGGTGTPPPESVISERELRHILDIFGTVVQTRHPEENITQYDPLLYIKAANSLLPAGKAKLLAAAREWYRVSFTLKMQRVFNLLQIMFDPLPSKSLSLQSVSPSADPPYPAEAMKVPRFPIVVVDDVPLLLYEASSGGLSNGSEYKAYLQYLESDFQLRKHPLQPPTNPLAVLEKVESSDQWLFGKHYLARVGDHILQYPYSSPDSTPSNEQINQQHALREAEVSSAHQKVMRQLLMLVAPVYPAARLYLGDRQIDFREIDMARWDQMRAEVSELKLKWDKQRNEYVRDK